MEAVFMGKEKFQKTVGWFLARHETKLFHLLRQQSGDAFVGRVTNQAVKMYCMEMYVYITLKY